MPFAKGNNANPLGRNVEKPFADALRMEITAAGADHRVLRDIARNLLRMAQIKSGTTALPAVLALADRLDGKPSQESVVSVVKRDASDWTRDELVAFLHDAAALQQATLTEREVKTIEVETIKELTSE